MSGERGFTLVEVLVALVVSGVLLAIVFDGAVAARARVRAADDRLQAVILADGLVTEAAAAPEVLQTAEGKTNELRWSLRQEITERDPRGLYALVRISADIRDKTGKPLFQATTRRLKPIPQ